MKSFKGRKALLILCLALFTAKASALSYVFSEDEEMGDDVPFKTLIMNGDIGPSVGALELRSDSDRLTVLMAGELKAGRRTVFLLTSEGGVREEAEEIAQVILDSSKKSYKKTGRPNLFVINQTCSSACTVLVAKLTKNKSAALEIFIQADSEFYFHAPTKIVIDGRVINLTTDPAFRKHELNLLLEVYENYGVRPNWIKSRRDGFENRKGFSIKARDLCKEYSLVIPPESCSTLSPNRFTEIIDEIYYENGTMGKNREVTRSLIRPPKLAEAFEGVSWIQLRAFFGIY